MEEDGKKRHLFQLETKRKEMLYLLPDKTIRQNIESMQKSIKGVQFPQSLCNCFWKSKFKRVDPLFLAAFDQLQAYHKINFYRRYIQSGLLIAKKKSRLPDTSNKLEDLSKTRQIINIQFKLKEDNNFADQTATLDNITKILESTNFRIDLHNAFISKQRDPQTVQSCIFFQSWSDNRKDFFLKPMNISVDFLFQRIQKIYCQAIEQNICQILGGGDEIRVTSSSEENAATERSLDQRMHASPIQRAQKKHTIKEVEMTNYLKHKHLNEPLPKTNQIKRLIPSKRNKHYFLEDDWQIDSDGKLIATNQAKLSVQGSVVKFIIKKLFTGSKLFHISLPVTVFNEESNLSLLISSYASAAIELQTAALQAKPLNRFLKVVRFNLLGPCAYIRCDKPFNPLMGQTYQAIVNGTPFYGEQISHHPPISAVFIKGRGYTAYGSFQAELKFGANSAAGNNKGWLKISFDALDIAKKIIRVNNIPGQMSGMLIGKRALNMVGTSYYIDEQNMLFLSLSYGQVKLKKTREYNDSVQGKIVKLKRGTQLGRPSQITDKDVQQELGIVWGRWLSQVYFNDSLLLDTRLQHPLEIERYPGLLPSDYSLRQDIRIKHREGDIQQCQQQKEKLQQIQRNDCKLREKYSP